MEKGKKKKKRGGSTLLGVLVFQEKIATCEPDLRIFLGLRPKPQRGGAVAPPRPPQRGGGAAPNPPPTHTPSAYPGPTRVRRNMIPGAHPCLRIHNPNLTEYLLSLSFVPATKSLSIPFFSLYSAQVQQLAHLGGRGPASAAACPPWRATPARRAGTSKCSSVPTSAGGAGPASPSRLSGAWAFQRGVPRGWGWAVGGATACGAVRAGPCPIHV